MIRIEPDEIQALAALSNMPEFQKVKKWLEKSCADSIQTMVKGADEFIRSKAAGSYEDLNEIIDKIDRAREYARDIELRQGRIQKAPGKSPGAY